MFTEKLLILFEDRLNNIIKQFSLKSYLMWHSYITKSKDRFVFHFDLDLKIMNKMLFKLIW